MNHPHDNRKFGTTKGLKPMADSLRSVTRKATGKKGAQFGQMLINWRQIVGDEISQKSVPIKLSFPQNKNGKATLHLSVKSADSVELQQYTEQLIDRVNRFFGYQAVERIKMVHLPPPLPSLQHRKKAGMVKLSSEQKTSLDNSLSDLEDENLRDALRAFGEGMLKNKSS